MRRRRSWTVSRLVSTTWSASRRSGSSIRRSAPMPSATDCAAHQRMRPARLAEPPQNRVVSRLEKHETHATPVLRLQPPVDGRETGQLTALPDIDDHRGPPALAALEAQVGERRNQRHGQVVHAEIAEVFERAQRVGLPRAGEARH